MKAENPTQLEKGKRERRLLRVTRGGFWYINPFYMGASDRYKTTPTRRYNTIGFRLVRNK